MGRDASAAAGLAPGLDPAPQVKRQATPEARANSGLGLT